MRKYPLLIILLLAVHSKAISQSSIYLGGGMSSIKIIEHQYIFPFFAEFEKKWISSPTISILGKSNLGKDVAISLGFIYNYTKFESPVLGHFTFNPVVGIELYRYAIPVRVHWNVFRKINLSGGLMFNNIYREEYTQLYTGKYAIEKTRPEIALNAGIDTEWRDFLIDLAITRSIFDPNVLYQGQYWILDINVYYKILSSKKK